MQNIFPILSHDYSLLIKIGDFGAAKFASAEDPLATGIGTWEHQAPEVFGDGPYTLAVDIWSLGTIFFTLLTGRPLFPNGMHLILISSNLKGVENIAPEMLFLPRE